LPIYEELKNRFSSTVIDLYLANGQEEFWKVFNYSDEYDYIFEIGFPCSENTQPLISKPQYCCMQEIGIDYNTISSKNVYFPHVKSPLVVVHFQSTNGPGHLSCPLEIAQEIWREIREYGLIPFECHFLHNYANPANKKYEFIDNNVRNYKSSVDNLVGLLLASRAFIGVLSGPFHLAYQIMRKNTLFLENRHRLETCIVDPRLPRVNVNSYTAGDITKWLKTIV
jgi:hypothetical protein